MPAIFLWSEPSLTAEWIAQINNKAQNNLQNFENLEALCFTAINPFKFVMHCFCCKFCSSTSTSLWHSGLYWPDSVQFPRRNIHHKSSGRQGTIHHILISSWERAGSCLDFVPRSLYYPFFAAKNPFNEGFLLPVEHFDLHCSLSYIVPASAQSGSDIHNTSCTTLPGLVLDIWRRGRFKLKPASTFTCLLRTDICNACLLLVYNPQVRARARRKWTMM